MDAAAPVIFILALIVLLVAAIRPAIRWVRKSSRRSAVFSAGIELLTAGQHPQPPAQIQVDAARRGARTKKESESGEPET